MGKSIAVVDLKTTVLAGVLHESRRRKPSAGQRSSTSDAAGSWEVAKGERWGALRTTSTCAFLQRGGDSQGINSYLEMEHSVMLFPFCDERITE